MTLVLTIVLFLIGIATPAVTVAFFYCAVCGVICACLIPATALSPSGGTYKGGEWIDDIKDQAKMALILLPSLAVISLLGWGAGTLADYSVAQGVKPLFFGIGVLIGVTLFSYFALKFD